jgi:hypothetical protein
MDIKDRKKLLEIAIIWSAARSPAEPGSGLMEKEKS